MNRVLTFLAVLVWFSVSSYAQTKFICRNGHSSFFSKAIAENIEAHNSQTSAVLDQTNGELAVSVPITGFQFEKALMQEHFNENYMESGKFPKATFKGKIVDFESLDFTNTPQQTVKIEGELTIHGVTKPVQVEGALEKTSNSYKGSTEFNVQVADYNIEIPKIVVDNIAKTIQVKVDLEFTPLAN